MFYCANLLFSHSEEGEVEKKIYITEKTYQIKYQLKYYKNYGYLLQSQENIDDILRVIKLKSKFCKQYLDNLLIDENHQYGYYNHFMELMKEEKIAESYQFLLKHYQNEETNDQMINLMMMRIHMEEYLGNLFKVNQDKKKAIHIFVQDFHRNGLIQNKVLGKSEMLGVQLLYIYLDCYVDLHSEIQIYLKEEKEKIKKNSQKNKEKATLMVLEMIISDDHVKLVHLLRKIEYQIKYLIVSGNAKTKSKLIGGLYLLLGDLHQPFLLGYSLEKEYELVQDFYKMAIRNKHLIGWNRLLSINYYLLNIRQLSPLQTIKVRNNQQLAIQQIKIIGQTNNQYYLDYQINHSSSILEIFPYIQQLINQGNYMYLNQYSRLIQILISIDYQQQKNNLLKELQTIYRISQRFIYLFAFMYYKQSNIIYSLALIQFIINIQHDLQDKYFSLYKLFKIYKSHHLFQDEDPSLVQNIFQLLYYYLIREIEQKMENNNYDDTFFIKYLIYKLLFKFNQKNHILKTTNIKHQIIFIKYILSDFDCLDNKIIMYKLRNNKLFIEYNNEINENQKLKEIEKNTLQQFYNDYIQMINNEIELFEQEQINFEFFKNKDLQSYTDNLIQKITQIILLSIQKQNKMLKENEKSNELKQIRQQIEEKYQKQNKKDRNIFYENYFNFKNEEIETISINDKIINQFKQIQMKQILEYIRKELEEVTTIFKDDQIQFKEENTGIFTENNQLFSVKTITLPQQFNLIEHEIQILKQILSFKSVFIVQSYGVNIQLFNNNNQIQINVLQLYFRNDNNQLNELEKEKQGNNRAKQIYKILKAVQSITNSNVLIKEFQNNVIIIKQSQFAKINLINNIFHQDLEQDCEKCITQCNFQYNLNEGNVNVNLYNSFQMNLQKDTKENRMKKMNVMFKKLQKKGSFLKILSNENGHNYNQYYQRSMQQLGLFIYNNIQCKKKVQKINELTKDQLDLQQLFDSIYLQIIKKLLFKKTVKISKIVNLIYNYIKQNSLFTLNQYKEVELIDDIYKTIQFDNYKEIKQKQEEDEEYVETIYLNNGLVYKGCIQGKYSKPSEPQIIYPSGKGRMAFQNEFIYEGSFQLGMFEGSGILYNIKQKLAFEGDFQQNQPKHGVIHQLLKSQNYKLDTGLNFNDQSAHYHIMFHQHLLVLQQDYINHICKQFPSSSSTSSFHQFHSYATHSHDHHNRNQIIDNYNNIIYYDTLNQNILILNSLFFSNHVFIYNSNISHKNILYSSLFSFALFNYLRSFQNIIQENNQYNFYYIFTQLKNHGVLHLNTGRKVEGTFQGLSLIQGIRFKKFFQFFNFNNQQSLFYGQIKDNKNRIYQGQIMQQNGKVYRQNYGEEKINDIFIYRGQYKKNFPHGKGLLIDIKNNRIIFSGIFKKGIIIRGKYYKEKDKVFEGIFQYFKIQQQSEILEQQQNLYENYEEQDQLQQNKLDQQEVKDEQQQNIHEIQDQLKQNMLEQQDEKNEQQQNELEKQEVKDIQQYNILEKQEVKDEQKINQYEQKEKLQLKNLNVKKYKVQKENLYCIYNIHSINDMIKNIQMKGWVNLTNGVNIYGIFNGFQDENISGQYKVINQNGNIVYKGNMSNRQKKGFGYYKIKKDEDNQIEIKGEWGGNQVTGVVKWDGRSQIDKSYGQFKFREQDIIMEHFGIQYFKDGSFNRGIFKDNNLSKIGQQNYLVKKGQKLVKVSYIGYYDSGHQNGFGIMEEEDKPHFKFKGIFQNNKKNGYGYYFKQDIKNIVLEGYFENDEILVGWLYLQKHEVIHKIEAYQFIFKHQLNRFEPQGIGRIFMKNKVVVECSIENILEKLESAHFKLQGLIIQPEGRVYSGEINSLFQMDGWGKLWVKGGKLLYEGQFQANIIQGFGKYYNKNTTYHIGNFDKAYKYGYGVEYSNVNDLEKIQIIGFWKFGLKNYLFKQITDSTQSTSNLIYLLFKNDQIIKVLVNQ